MNGVICGTLIPIPISDPCSRKSLTDPMKAKTPDRSRPVRVSSEWKRKKHSRLNSAVYRGVIKLSRVGDAISVSPTMIIRYVDISALKDLGGFQSAKSKKIDGEN